MPENELRRRLRSRLDFWPDDLNGESVPVVRQLARHTDVRPARQVLYPHAKLEKLEELVSLAGIPKPKSPRFQITRFRGRVEEYEAKTKQVLVTLWEEPSGRASRAILERRDFPKVLGIPRRDLAFFLWTWFELTSQEMISKHLIESPSASKKDQNGVG